MPAPLLNSSPSSAGAVLAPRRFRSTFAHSKGLWLAGPALIWLLVFLLLPLMGIVAISFLSLGANGEVELPLTFENYKRFAGFGLLGFDPLYPQIILRSVGLAALTTLLCALLGLPVAFFIAALSPRMRPLGLILVVIPLWINLLIRTYAWQIVLGSGGWPAQIATALGWMNAGDALYPSMLAICIGMVCDFIPFLVLPLYASVEKIDWTLAEAAMDLGGGRWKVMRHAIFPQIAPGLAAGTMLVFLPALGQFVVPDLLGGAKALMIGNSIQQQFGPSRDWPFGAAISVLVLVLVTLSLWIYSRQGRNKPNSLDAL